MNRLLAIWFTKELSEIFDLKRVNPILEELVSKEALVWKGHYVRARALEWDNH